MCVCSTPCRVPIVREPCRSILELWSSVDGSELHHRMSLKGWESTMHRHTTVENSEVQEEPTLISGGSGEINNHDKLWETRHISPYSLPFRIALAAVAQFIRQKSIYPAAQKRPCDTVILLTHYIERYGLWAAVSLRVGSGAVERFSVSVHSLQCVNRSFCQLSSTLFSLICTEPVVALSYRVAVTGAVQFHRAPLHHSGPGDHLHIHWRICSKCKSSVTLFLLMHFILFNMKHCLTCYCSTD